MTKEEFIHTSLVASKIGLDNAYEEYISGNNKIQQEVIAAEIAIANIINDLKSKVKGVFDVEVAGILENVKDGPNFFETFYKVNIKVN